MELQTESFSGVFVSFGAGSVKSFIVPETGSKASPVTVHGTSNRSGPLPSGERKMTIELSVHGTVGRQGCADTL